MYPSLCMNLLKCFTKLNFVSYLDCLSLTNLSDYQPYYISLYLKRRSVCVSVTSILIFETNLWRGLGIPCIAVGGGERSSPQLLEMKSRRTLGFSSCYIFSMREILTFFSLKRLQIPKIVPKSCTLRCKDLTQLHAGSYQTHSIGVGYMLPLWFLRK